MRSHLCGIVAGEVWERSDRPLAGPFKPTALERGWGVRKADAQAYGHVPMGRNSAGWDKVITAAPRAQAGAELRSK